MKWIAFLMKPAVGRQIFALISEELLPHLEKRYRITSHRTLIGHSYGGLFTIDALLSNI